MLLLLGGLGAFSAVSSGIRLYNWAAEAPPPPPPEFHRPFTEEQVRQLGEVHNVKDVRDSLERFRLGKQPITEGLKSISPPFFTIGAGASGAAWAWASDT